MKIVSLNLWGGRIYEPLAEFLKNHQDTDIFCFQEIYHEGTGKDTEFREEVDLELFTSIGNLLPNHISFFRPHLGDFWGLATFIKKGVKVLEEGEYFVHKHKGWQSNENKNFTPKNIQYVKVDINSQYLTMVNFHGHWNGAGKTDTDDRLIQSDNVIKYMTEIGGPYILCGDFNLLPDTLSIKKFEDFGLRNLIKEYDIKSTRTSFYKKSHKFADYIFISEKLNVRDFRVLTEEVSDHSALYLEVKV